jgi:hypothetical protein
MSLKYKAPAFEESEGFVFYASRRSKVEPIFDSVIIELSFENDILMPEQAILRSLAIQL